eukprot:2721202-Rhodomonas_salina.3
MRVMLPASCASQLEEFVSGICPGIEEGQSREGGGGGGGGEEGEGEKEKEKVVVGEEDEEAEGEGEEEEQYDDDDDDNSSQDTLSDALLKGDKVTQIAHPNVISCSPGRGEVQKA